MRPRRAEPRPGPAGARGAARARLAPPAPRPAPRSDPWPARPSDAPFLGVGVGLRPVHQTRVLAAAREGRLEVDWLEVIGENHLVAGGRPRRVLEELAGRVPLVLHGVSMNLGSTDPLDAPHLDALGALAVGCGARWMSDHLCWTGVGGRSLHDLLPLPATGEVVRHVAARIARAQDRLGRRIAIENVSSYVSFREDELPEWAFLGAVAEEADCGILLDVNNLHVSAHNHGFDPCDYLDAIDASRIFQVHLGGHSEGAPLLVDTHDHPVCEPVWHLYERLLARTGPVSTSIEWDDQLPDWERLVAEAERARRSLARVAGAAGADARMARGGRRARPREDAASLRPAGHGA